MWQNSSLTLRFYIVDGRAVFAIVVLIYAPSKTTAILSLLFFGFLGALEYASYDIPNILRRLRLFISGKIKTAKPYDIR